MVAATKMPREVRMARIEYIRTQRELANARTRYEVSLVDVLEREARGIAQRTAQLLGHMPLRQRDAVECSRCEASGTAGAELRGTLYEQACEAKP